MSEAPQHAQARGAMVQGLGNASALHKKPLPWPTFPYWPHYAWKSRCYRGLGCEINISAHPTCGNDERVITPPL
jgi:hypothetical protein